jgi:hypothetical protein
MGSIWTQRCYSAAGLSLFHWNPKTWCFDSIPGAFRSSEGIVLLLQTSLHYEWGAGLTRVLPGPRFVPGSLLAAHIPGTNAALEYQPRTAAEARTRVGIIFSYWSMYHCLVISLLTSFLFRHLFYRIIKSYKIIFIELVYSGCAVWLPDKKSQVQTPPSPSLSKTTLTPNCYLTTCMSKLPVSHFSLCG